MSTEAVGWIVGAIITVGGAVLGVLMSHGSKLATIIQQLVNLEARADENRDDHGRLWSKVDDHEHRITQLESRHRDD
jgi:hypothetical protein